MKIILSRKGVDSAAGGEASYITRGGDLICIPIPEKNAVGHSTNYASIHSNIGDLGNFVAPFWIVPNGTKQFLVPRSKAHLDPDLCSTSLPRKAGWIAAFGQRTPSAVHLLDRHVDRGTLFLFYGWFRDACATFRSPMPLRGKNSHYAPMGRSLHLIFGYLQVEQCYKGEDTGALLAAFPALSDHPHLNTPRVNTPNNRLYIATDRLQIDGLCKSLPGAGVFAFDQRRRLTAAGEHRRSHWRLEGWRTTNNNQPIFDRDAGAFIGWTPHGVCDWEVINHGYGQEFAIDTKTHPDVLKWVLNLF
jgi:hypothetical protein